MILLHLLQECTKCFNGIAFEILAMKSITKK